MEFKCEFQNGVKPNRYTVMETWYKKCLHKNVLICIRQLLSNI